MLNTPSLIRSNEANECKNQADVSTRVLKAYYQQQDAPEFNFHEALDALVTLTDHSQKTVHSEQQKKFLEFSNRPSLALYMGIRTMKIDDDRAILSSTSYFSISEQLPHILV